MILQLVQDPRNLSYFLEHDTMLTALTRILNEERRKSVDLVGSVSEIHISKFDLKLKYFETTILVS
jgi:hypothetical protein